MRLLKSFRQQQKSCAIIVQVISCTFLSYFMYVPKLFNFHTLYIRSTLTIMLIDNVMDAIVCLAGSARIDQSAEEKARLATFFHYFHSI